MRSRRAGSLRARERSNDLLTNGAGAYGEVVWSRRLDAGVKPAEAKPAQPGAGKPYPLATVTNKPDHRGEHEVSRKTIVCGNAGCPVYSW
jgi:hypothetical protein